MEIRAVTHYSVDVTQAYPRLMSNELGTFPDYQHEILLTDDAVSSAKKLRPAPLARCQKVSEEVQNMDDLGIWEATDKSSWVHHMVTFPKPNGDYRITTDLSPLNREKYLLGRHLTLRTDDSSLASLLRSTIRKSAKFTRWVDRLSPFDYIVEYRQAKRLWLPAFINFSPFETSPNRGPVSATAKSHCPSHCFATTPSKQSPRRSPRYCPHEVKTPPVVLVVRSRQGNRELCKALSQLSDKSLAPANVSATSIPLPESPWQKVAIDVTETFLTAPQSSKFLVVIIDYKRKFPEIPMARTVLLGHQL
ncbi:hypothetical protein PoB_004669500 [Plakobranchus ocellatus]|uniref:Uncharacterized protein n=1 Tax=Plakobranchus ocellatus TaxID=259542 RepID=A0AAV4BMA8_9GAST|nr:hypothetical protein PoB_004669500 [Plakobranchus ocellatus]